MTSARRCTIFAAVVLAWALALSTSAASANPVVVGFDDLSSGTAIGEQYAALGVHFGPSPFAGQSGGFTATARGQARSAPNVAAFAYDSGTDFSSSWIKFDKQQSMVSFYACRTGGGGDPPTPNVNVVAYDSNGNVVDNQSGIVCNLNGPLVPVTVQKDHITYLNVYATGGSAPPGPGWGLDDLAFDTTPAPQPPPPKPPPPPTPPSPDFSLDFLEGPTTPHVLALRPGTSVTRPLVVGRNETSSGPIQLTASGLPAGVTATFSPAVSNANRAEVVIMTLTAAASAPSTLAMVTVRGAPQAASAGATDHTTTLDVVVQGELAAYLKGIEITQGVQTLNQPNVSPYKGVTLVSGKKTVVRVYAGFVGSEAPGSPRPEISMILSGQDHSHRLLPGSPLAVDWAPPPGSLTLNSTSIGPNERVSPSRAFVFTVPDSWTNRGTIALSARPVAAAEPSPFNRPDATGATVCIEASCGATPYLDLNSIPFMPTPAPLAINAVEQDLTFLDTAGNPLPTLRPVDAVRTFARLMQISPVPFTFLDAFNNPSPIPRYRAIRNAPTTKIWEDADAFDQQIGRVGHSTFGAFNDPAAAGVTFPSSGVFRVSVGTSDPLPDGTPSRPLTVIAHEVVHTFGIGHADQSQAAGGCGGGGGGFPTPDGRLNSVGIDTLFLSGGGVGAPPYRMISDSAATPGYDLMSYCAALGGGDPNSWISAINWNAMLGSGAPPAARSAEATTASAVAPALHVRARLQNGSVQIESVGRATGFQLEPTASPYVLVARDRQGRVLASVAMRTATGEEARDAPPAYSILDANVPVAGVATVQVTSGGTVVASRTASPRPPTATFITPKANSRLGSARIVSVKWLSSGSAGAPVQAELDYSSDDGRSFHPIYGAGTARFARLPIALLQPSKRARLRLRLNDGFNDAQVVSRAFVVGPRAPTVTILDPVAHRLVAAGSSLYLHGGAVDAMGRAIASARLRWMAGPTVLGRGNMISAILPRGTRRIELVAVDRTGRVGTAFVVVGMRATTPFFTRLGVPRSLSKRAHFLRLTLAATQPSILQIGKLRTPVGRQARHLDLKITPGRSILHLRLRLSAGGRALTQPVVITRR